MRQQGRTSPRTPYSTEYRNRKGFSQTIEGHGERLTRVELRAGGVPVDDSPRTLEVYKNGFRVGAQNILDLIEGTNVTLTVTDDGTAIRVEIAATGTGGSGYVTVEDEGAPLTQRSTIDFVGAGVTAADAGGKTVVTIPGGSSTGYDTIEDEGTPLAQETVIDFQGAGVVATAGAGKTVVTIPGDTGGGVFASDAVVAPNFPGADGDPTTLATGEIVLMYTTPQAAYDAYANGDFPAGSSTRAVIRLNRNDDQFGVGLDLDMSAAAGAIYIYGEGQFGVENHGGGPAQLGNVSIIDPDNGVVMRDLVILGELLASGANANDQGMMLQLTNVAIQNLTGGIRGVSGLAAMQNCTIGAEWQMTPTAQATANVFARFENLDVNGPWFALVDVVIAGIYSFQGSTFTSGIFFVVGTDKHFGLTAECHVYGNMEFQMDGGTLTLDLDAFHLHDGARIVITDLGGGGTVIINWSGGSVEQTAAPVIEADATIVVTGSVDGVALLGTPNSPAFKGQFVDFAFGDAITPPSYVVEFL